MLRIGALLLSISAIFLVAAPRSIQAQTPVPAYFFSQWTVQTNCAEVGFDPTEHTLVGLQFSISAASLSEDGTSYGFQPISSSANQVWPDGWSELALQYRSGVQMTNVPADFVCIPGEPASSSLLAMSNYTQSAEPYYEYEHWYALGTLHGEPHHVLVFPRNVVGTDSAIIIVLDAGASGNVQLDQDGSIHSGNN